MTKTIPLVRASAVLPFVQFLHQLGSPTDRLLEQAKFPIAALHDSETIALVLLYQSFAFAEQAARLEGINHLGIIVAQQTSVFQMGIFGKQASPRVSFVVCTTRFYRNKAPAKPNLTNLIRKRFIANRSFTILLL